MSFCEMIWKICVRKKKKKPMNKTFYLVHQQKNKFKFIFLLMHQIKSFIHRFFFFFSHTNFPNHFTKRHNWKHCEDQQIGDYFLCISKALPLETTPTICMQHC